MLTTGDYIVAARTKDVPTETTDVAAETTDVVASTIESSSESNNVVSPSRVRTHFPETWLWFDRKNRYSIFPFTSNRK